MSRTAASAVFALALALVALVATIGPRAAADAGGHRIVYLYVSGQGPQAKAWYSGGPPSGVPVQDALDTFAAQGLKFVGIASSGTPTLTSPGSTLSGESRPAADYLLLLER